MLESSNRLRDLLDVEGIFTDRPAAVPGDLRSRWRVALLALLLDRCHGKSATLEQVHVVGWALMEDQGRRHLSDALDGNLRPDAVIVRYDPAWSRAADLSVGEGVTEWVPETGRLRLTETGRAVARSLWEEESIFVEEKEFLHGRLISQAAIQRMLGGA